MRARAKFLAIANLNKFITSANLGALDFSSKKCNIVYVSEEVSTISSHSNNGNASLSKVAQKLQ